MVFREQFYKKNKNLELINCPWSFLIWSNPCGHIPRWGKRGCERTQDTRKSHLLMTFK